MKNIYAFLGVVIVAYQLNDVYGNNWAWLFVGTMLYMDSVWQQIEEYFSK